ncbi:dimethylhistidine N-methyltransferase [Palleronia marisminoris]|uniref:Histidine-specific methyltransferase EgtD n=1 Tax=Palleronia marisminoris TaxID=315423 RepID=A0A1Y5TH76_9RHOB|nr:L-histidine N(alpha)-methyltransferase [Palleronia marisminoris]SFH39311.1 dimethylhistidine N-methyltransferase [Palleronia marisminoris]SLN63955.1 Histidine-specific methyltransferase EgtD [Palleronia marisminoris]
MSTELLEDAIAGLSASPKTLSPKWLYDERGSELFEQITELPEYYLTRAETGILEVHAGKLVDLVPAGGALIELGSGASVKTRLLLDAATHLDAYVPVDISADFLHRTADDLRGRYPDLRIVPLVGDFSQPLDLPQPVMDHPKVGFFPGSTIGNLGPRAARALLRNARTWRNVQGFILGFDLVKNQRELVAAYDDARGVTARFIGNILVRLNRETGANFDPEAFSYEARWNAEATRIDMRLVSTRQQVVDLAGTRIAFEAGESIHVSASRKFTPDSLAALVGSAGWKLDRTLTDAGNRFAIAFLTPA